MHLLVYWLDMMLLIVECPGVLRSFILAMHVYQQCFLFSCFIIVCVFLFVGPAQASCIVLLFSCLICLCIWIVVVICLLISYMISLLHVSLCDYFFLQAACVFHRAVGSVPSQVCHGGGQFQRAQPGVIMSSSLCLRKFLIMQETQAVIYIYIYICIYVPGKSHIIQRHALL